MSNIVPTSNDPLAVTTDELQAAFRDIVQVLSNGEDINREALNMFLTAPRIDVNLADYARVLSMLEKSSDWNADALYVIRIQAEIIRRLVSAQTLSILDRVGPGMSVVGEVTEKTRTVRFATMPASVHPSVSSSVFNPDSVRFPSDRSFVSTDEQAGGDNVWRIDRTNEQTDAANGQTDDERTDKQRKEYVKDARARADKYLKQALKKNPNVLKQLSADKLAARLGIGRTVAAEALRYARGQAKFDNGPTRPD